MADRERDVERMDSDSAGVGPYARDTSRLVPMSTLDDWDVVEDEPDIRGWEVRTVSGRDLGEVKDLLVDPDAREVVMLDVDLRGSDQHALVPIRIVEIDRERRVIRMDSSDLRTVGEGDAEVARTVEAGDIPVPAAMPPAELDRRAQAVTGEPAVDANAETEAAAERDILADQPDVEEKVVETRPVVVEETVVRRRTVDRPEDRI